MPQLDFTTFVPQVVWLVLTFIALFLIMWKLAVPRIAETLELRQKKLEQNLEKAATLKAEAEAAEESYEKALAAARAEAHEAIAKVQADMKAKQEAEGANLGEKLRQRIEEGEAAINDAVQSALADVGGIAQEVAKAACERLTGETPDDAAVAKAVAAAQKARGA
ncbi:MAG: F0F1 ATP synthase subunit B' [Rhodospirillaceae bacterium]